MNTNLAFLAEARIADLHRDAEHDRLARRAFHQPAPIDETVTIRLRRDSSARRIHASTAGACAAGGD